MAISAAYTLPHRQIDWKENPYSIQAIEVYANNNLQAMELAQAQANEKLKKFT